MARKSKKKKSNQAPIQRSTLVNISKRDETLVDDLQNMGKKGAIKHSNHLMKLISSDAEYEALLFNIPLLRHLLKKNELEKKTGGLKNKLFKSSFVKTGAKYYLPHVVDNQYVAKAKNILLKKFNSDPNHEDKMALAIARASLEMYGKTYKGSLVPLSDIPLFHIVLSVSMEVAQNISKAQKNASNDKDGQGANYEKSSSLYSKWDEDMVNYQKKLEHEIHTISDESLKIPILDTLLTINLQSLIVLEIEKGNLQVEDLTIYINSKKLKAKILNSINPLAKKTITIDLSLRRNLIVLYMEKSIEKNFSEKKFLIYAYLLFITSPNLDILAPIYTDQALLSLSENDFKLKQNSYYIEESASSSNKESRILNLQAAYYLGKDDGEHVYKIVQLYKDLKLGFEGKLLYQKFLANENSKNDRFYKKIQKDWQKNFS